MFFTLFRSAAFAKLAVALKTTPEALASNSQLVLTVLSYHLVPGVAAKAADLTNGEQPPTQNSGQNITVDLSSGKVKLKPSAKFAPEATVIQPDIVAGKGIVHIIDEVRTNR